MMDNEMIDMMVLENLKSTFDSKEEMKDFIGELLDIFFIQSPEIIHKINNAVINKDAKNLMFYSHKLKGLSSNLGVTAIVNLCQKIENNPDPENETIIKSTNQLPIIFNKIKQDLTEKVDLLSFP